MNEDNQQNPENNGQIINPTNSNDNKNQEKSPDSTTSVQPTVSQSTETVGTPAVQPQQDQTPTANGQTATPATVNQNPKTKKPIKLIIAAALGLLLLAGGAAAFMNLSEKTPEEVWREATVNTSTGLANYLETSKTRPAGSKINGSFNISSPVVAEGSMSGQINGTSAEGQVTFMYSGIDVAGEIKIISEEGTSTPSAYFKLTGINSALPLLGIPSFQIDQLSGVISEVDGTWYEIDRSLVDSFLDGYSSSLAEQQTEPQISEEEIIKVSEDLANILQDRLFSTEEGKTVIEVIEYLGEEDFEGTDTYKYLVGVSKEGLKNMLGEMINAVKGTEVEALLLEGTQYESIEELYDLESINQSIDNANFDNINAHAWVEKNGAYIRNLRMYPVEGREDSNYMDMGFPITESGTLPLSIKLTINDDGQKGTLAFGTEVNETNADSRLWMDIDLESSGVKFIANAEVSVEGTDDEITIEKPADSKSIYDLLEVFGLSENILSPTPGGTNLLPTSFEEQI